MESKQSNRRRRFNNPSSDISNNPTADNYGAKFPVSTFTVYSASSGTALAQTLAITTATVFSTYSAFAAYVGNFSQYRVDSITIRVNPVPGVSAAGLFPTGLHLVPFSGTSVPAQTVSNLARFPQHRVFALFDKGYVVKWRRTKDKTDFYPTSSAAPIYGGIAGYIGAAAPTSSCAYMTIEVEYGLTVRGRVV